jgi:hypothetical protein
MKRLGDLTIEEILAWLDERRRVGSEKYGDAHLQRYGLVDVVEKLIDAMVIAGLVARRCILAGAQNAVEINELLYKLSEGMAECLLKARRIDKLLSDELCTDEQSGERIWWPPVDKEV